MTTTEAAWQRTAETLRLQTIERAAREYIDSDECGWHDLDKLELLNTALAAAPQPADELQDLENDELHKQLFASMQAPSKNTEALITRLTQREERGLSKYGTTLDRTDMEPGEWIQHAQDEALDLAAYLEGLKQHRFPCNAALQDEATRLRTILLSEISRLEKEANAHEGEDFGNTCRVQAERLRGEMGDV